MPRHYLDKAVCPMSATIDRVIGWSAPAVSEGPQPLGSTKAVPIDLRRRRLLHSFLVLGLAAGIAGAEPAIRGWGRLSGRMRRLVLRDGSTIALDANAIVRMNADESALWLDSGDALFRILRPAGTRLRVIVGNDEVNAADAIFEVSRKRDSTRITVLEGVIAYYHAFGATGDGGQRARVLHAGQQFIS